MDGVKKKPLFLISMICKNNAAAEPSAPRGQPLHWKGGTNSFVISNQKRLAAGAPYFNAHNSETTSVEILSALNPRAKRLFIAEYALRASVPSGVPHLLAALTRATLAAVESKPDSNIRTALAPSSIIELAEAAGWHLQHDNIFVPDAELQDGGWESSSLASEAFVAETRKQVQDARLRSALSSIET